MPKVYKKGEKVRRFILENVSEHPEDIALVTAAEFGISRQGAHDHLNKLVDQKALIAKPKGKRGKVYRLHATLSWSERYKLKGLEEDDVYAYGAAQQIKDLPQNVQRIWSYGVTEMVNNAIDHSEGSHVSVFLKRTAIDCSIHIADNGVGIFRKIQNALELADEREAFLELAKGKFTTDPERHTGEGIFFSRHMFDEFAIASGDVFWSHSFGHASDFLLPQDSKHKGTSVLMKLSNHTSRTPKAVFDSFKTENNPGFSKTVVPVYLAKVGDEFLVSRSQAKRVLARVENFECVIFDFAGVDEIGQAFADEIFRVWKNKHPEVDAFHINANDAVESMIRRAEMARNGNA